MMNHNDYLIPSAQLMEQALQAAETHRQAALEKPADIALLEREEDAQRLLEKYRTIFENSIVALSFYSPEGKLIDANRIMREICHFDSDSGDSFFSSVNLFDMAPFNEVLDRNNVEEFWGCSLSVVPERNMHVYLEIRLHPIRDEHGNVVYLAIAVRDISEERDMYQQAKENEARMQVASKAIQNYERELRYMMETCDMRVFRTSFAEQKIYFYRGLSTIVKEMTLEELTHLFLDEDSYAIDHFKDPHGFFSKDSSRIVHTRSLFHEDGRPQWSIINSIPVYDDKGVLTGGFGVIRNVTALLEKQQLLREETERAKASEQLKTIFLANMTHEIRTPLNAIVGFIDVLPLLSTKEEKQEIVRLVMTNCDMLLRLVNDVLSLSTIESGQLELSPAKVNFAKMFVQQCEELKERVEPTGVEYIIDSPFDAYEAVIDEGRVRQVMTNFLTNAVKYTHEGHIKMGYHPEVREADGLLREGICLYCEDTGEGVDQEAQKRIFDRFFKVNEYVQGMGIGLTLCKLIAEASHGQMGVKSEGKGKGSTFWMWIPRYLATLLLLVCFWLPGSAQMIDGVVAHSDNRDGNLPEIQREYSQEHPLVYEDAWDLWPYSFLNENGEPVGYNIDLLHLLLGELDIPFVVKLRDTSAALNDLKTGKSDLMCGMDANYHNDYARYGQTVIQIFTHSMVHQKGEPVVINTLEDLARHRVIVHEGSFSHHLMIERGWGRNAITYDDMKEAVQRAHYEAGNQILWNTLSLKWLIRQMKFDNLEMTPVKVPHGEYKFMSNNAQLLHQLDSVYTKLDAEGKLQVIQNKWFYPERNETGIPAWIWQTAVAMVLLFLMALLYYAIYRRQERKMTSAIVRSNKRLALILKTSGVNIWLYDVASRRITQFDDEGRESLAEPSLRYFFYHLRSGDLGNLTSALKKVATGKTDRMTLDVMSQDEQTAGKYRNLSISISVLRHDKNGHPVSIIGTTSDVTDIHVRHQEAKNMMLRYQSIFNSTMVDTFTYDAQGVMTDMNKKATEFFPEGKERAIAKRLNIREVMGTPQLSLEDLSRTYMTRLFDIEKDVSVRNKELLRDHIYFELQVVPVRDADGHLMSIFTTGRDVTEMVNSYRQMKRNAEEMEQANRQMSDYIRNIDFVLKNGGVRMVRYSPDTHTIIIYSGSGQKQHQLTQTRALALTDDTAKMRAQRLLNSMDNRATTIQTAALKTLIRVDGNRRLSLYFSFVPTLDAKGNVTGYFGMCRDITDIKTTEEELARETARAQEVETVKNAFLRNMSYEIRTPLNSVVGFAELFQMPHAPEDETLFIQEIKNNSSHLLHLINDILFLSRLDARMIEFKYQPTDFAAYFGPRCEASWHNHHPEGVELLLENPYQRLVVDIDEQNLGMVMDQIIANAAHYTVKGQVRIYYDYTGEELVIAFQDTGCGITKERLDQIFERFVSTGGKGTGLGLSICHEIVQQMGGKIRIKSTVGIGTIVWVSIPCKCTEIVRK